MNSSNMMAKYHYYHLVKRTWLNKPFVDNIYTISMAYLYNFDCLLNAHSMIDFREILGARICYRTSMFLSELCWGNIGEVMIISNNLLFNQLLLFLAMLKFPSEKSSLVIASFKRSSKRCKNDFLSRFWRYLITH